MAVLAARMRFIAGDVEAGWCGVGVQLSPTWAECVRSHLDRGSCTSLVLHTVTADMWCAYVCLFELSSVQLEKSCVSH